MPKLTDWLKERAAQADPAPRAKPLQHAWYKVNGMDVHLDGRDLPPPCAKCRGISEYFCDYPVAGVTCSAPLCRDCAKGIGFAARRSLTQGSTLSSVKRWYMSTTAK